jgi:hypothetical protein
MGVSPAFALTCRAARQCGFIDALRFLADVAGVEFRLQRVTPQERERTQQVRARAEAAAMSVSHEIRGIRVLLLDDLHRTNRLCTLLGKRLAGSTDDAGRELLWSELAELAPAQTAATAALNYLDRASAETLARFALLNPEQRAAEILRGSHE